MRVFPCSNKQPLVDHWQEEAKPREEWGAEWDDHTEWGAPTGEAAGFWVADFDKKSDGLVTLENLGIGSSYEVVTGGGGKHLYFKWTDECGDLRNRVGILPGFDVRANGGYVCLYDSPAEVSNLTVAPSWLLTLVKQPNKKVAAVGAGEVVEGGRNHFLTSAAGRMQKLGVLTLSALKETNETKCSPPLPDNEVERIFQNVSKYQPESSPAEDEPPIVWASDLVKAMLEYLTDKDLVRGEPTGLKELDDLLGGGKRLGELSVTLAEAKTGKNTLWHALMVGWLEKGLAVGYASRELSPETEVLPNLLTVVTRLNYYKLPSYDEEVIAKRIEGWKLAFAPGYGPFFGDELMRWLDNCREAGIQYFFIDHLHYCLDDPEDYKKISLFIRNLKAYCKKHQVHIDLIVQPKIQEMGSRLSLNSLRGGASIGQALDNLITMVRERDESGKLINIVKVTLEVARSKLASVGEFFLEYDKDSMTFSPVERVEEEESPSIDDSVPVADRGSWGKRLD